jgi:hypothetical protein
VKPTNDRHALYVGWVMGMAWRHGLPFQPDNEGNRLVWHVRPGLSITLVVPPPADSLDITTLL